MESIYEWCPHCEEEVEIEEKFEVQICPNCGKPILPCGLVKDCNYLCKNCPLDEKLKQVNEELGFTD